jgi:hypothetical protein
VSLDVVPEALAAKMRQFPVGLVALRHFLLLGPRFRSCLAAARVP